ncbi:MAG: hypothetical protein ACOX0N_01400 [Syntrophomonadaceae bacterium]|jgi:hypothetical protein|nr:hypothetical protein [Syntrophomonadaceae bacterium]
MTMPKDVEYGGERPEDISQKEAKGKKGNGFVNDLFASIENFFYEFGLINKANPENREEAKQDEKLTQQDQHQPGDFEPSSYLSDEEVLLSQKNKIGQQYWEDEQPEGEQENGYSDTHIEV